MAFATQLYNNFCDYIITIVVQKESSHFSDQSKTHNVLLCIINKENISYLMTILNKRHSIIRH
jgi:hypothetical protein